MRPRYDAPGELLDLRDVPPLGPGRPPQCFGRILEAQVGAPGMLLDLRDGQPLGRVDDQDGAQQLLHLARCRPVRGEPIVCAHYALQQLRTHAMRPPSGWRHTCMHKPDS